jgi:hypothetical protein
MTTPYERTRAVLFARELLWDLCSITATPRVPKAVRERARHVLRHYPDPMDLEQAGPAFVGAELPNKLRRT